MNPSILEHALVSAWERKAALHAATGAVRLLNAHATGTPRVVCELYGTHALLFNYGTDAGGEEASLRAAASRWLEMFGWESVSLHDRASAGDAGRAGHRALAGEAPEELVITEEGLRVRLEPRHPRNVGLFLDTRVLRANLRAGEDDAQIRAAAGGARVLNLFCYTGSLGLAALAGGATSVAQVDISARYLDWARANTRLNALPEDSCRFVRMDSERYLDWALRKGLRFDRIILDPPVFSRFDGKVFRWADDYFRLAAKCATLLAPRGVLHAITNYAGIRPAVFAQELTRTFREAGVGAAPPQRVPLPADYDLPPDTEDLPEGNAMIFSLTRE